jgi:undecaprenyl-diphosphatase
MNPLGEADREAYRVLHSRLRAGWLDPVMVQFTHFGTKGAVWFALAVGFLIGGSTHARAAAILASAALLLAEGLINWLLKPIIRRDRPYKHPGLSRLLVSAPGPHSWPSAHAGSSAAAALVLSVFYPLWSPLFLAVAFLIAYSRVYVGVHYPLDVLAGIAVGIVAALGVLGISALGIPVVRL